MRGILSNANDIHHDISPQEHLLQISSSPILKIRFAGLAWHGRNDFFHSYSSNDTVELRVDAVSFGLSIACPGTKLTAKSYS